MSKDGVSTDKIAKWCRLTSDDVVAALAKRRRTEDTLEGVTDRQAASHTEAEEEGMESLVSRLLSDPDDLLCPILHTLMEQPVVAEDGFTYEKEAIEHALNLRPKSPKTNEPMGDKVIPNQEKVAAILDFKQKTIDEILSVASHIPSDLAQKLLQRAEDFIRPKLPDGAYQRKLAKVLQLKAGLPSEQDVAVSQLLCLLADNPQAMDVRQFLENFYTWEVWPILRSCRVHRKDDLVEVLRKAASTAPTMACAEDLDRLRASRLAAGVKAHGGGFRQNLASFWNVNKLWRFVLPRASGSVDSVTDPGMWLEGAALVLAGLHVWLRLKSPFCLPDVPEKLLAESISCLRTLSPEDFGARVCLFFGTDADVWNENSDLTGWTENYCDQDFLASLFLELSRRRSGDRAAQKELLLQALDASPTHDLARDSLLQLFLESLDIEGSVEEEHVLITLLLAKHDQVPEETLSKLTLAPDQVKELKLAPPTLLGLANQLAAADRSEQGARLAVHAATQFDAMGDQENAMLAYGRAYSMDRRNEDALHGMVGSCSRVMKMCSELQVCIENLQEKVQILQRQRLRLALPSKVWDIPPEDLRRCDTMVSGDYVESPMFHIGDSLSATLRYYPRGSQAGQRALATIALLCDDSCAVSGKIRIGSQTVVLRARVPSDRKSWDIPAADYRQVRVWIKSVRRQDSSLTHNFVM
ncbi:WDSUB1 [Symbiodinium necroappetens]|uniref:WDSUB1 protein n=1 Tax=Symbiodinium necroappetens TaxID=1628268 RepID=A0A812PNS0_9DINO|nr:WDSUB1 [Symbiodinium necroappetens]